MGNAWPAHGKLKKATVGLATGASREGIDFMDGTRLSELDAALISDCMEPLNDSPPMDSPPALDSYDPTEPAGSSSVCTARAACAYGGCCCCCAAAYTSAAVGASYGSRHTPASENIRGMPDAVVSLVLSVHPAAPDASVYQPDPSKQRHPLAPHSLVSLLSLSLNTMHEGAPFLLRLVRLERPRLTLPSSLPSMDPRREACVFSGVRVKLPNESRLEKDSASPCPILLTRAMLLVRLMGGPLAMSTSGRMSSRMSCELVRSRATPSMLLLEANMGSPVAARCMPARLGGESNMSRGDVEVDSVCSASDTKEEERESERWRDSCSSPRDLVIAALSIAGRSSPIMRSREDDDVSTLLIPAIVSG